ncbi:hypothetical protein D3C73_1510890 [compost metagenome]
MLRQLKEIFHKEHRIDRRHQHVRSNEQQDLIRRQPINIDTGPVDHDNVQQLG